MEEELAYQAATPTQAPSDSIGAIDIAAVGRRLKQIYPTGVASDGRSYLDIPDEEIGSKYILKNGAKGISALGMGKMDGESRTEGETTKYNLAKTGLQSLKNVEKFYEEDPGVLSKQIIPGKFESRSFDSALFGAVDTLLRIRTGATAPEEEIRRYMSAYGPQFGDTPEDVAFKMNQLKNALSSEGGLSEKEVNTLYPTKQTNETGEVAPATGIQQQQGFQTVEPGAVDSMELVGNQPVSEEEVAQQAAGGRKGLLEDTFIEDLLFSGIKNAREKQEKGEDLTLGDKAAAVGDVASTVIPFAKIPKLGLAAKAALAGAIEGSTRDPEAGAKDRVVGGTIGAALGGALAAPLQLGGKIINTARGKGVESAVAARKAIAEATSTKFSGKEFLKAGEEYIKNDPLAQKTLDRLKPSLEGKIFDAPELLNKLEVWNKAYSAAGSVGKSEKAGLYNKLAQSARSALETEAPQVFKAQKALAKEIGSKKLVGKIFEPASIAKTALGTGLGFGLYDIYNKIKGK